jgi:hypothetical protein
MLTTAAIFVVFSHLYHIHNNLSGADRVTKILYISTPRAVLANGPPKKQALPGVLSFNVCHFGNCQR